MTVTFRKVFSELLEVNNAMQAPTRGLPGQGELNSRVVVLAMILSVHDILIKMMTMTNHPSFRILGFGHSSRFLGIQTINTVWWARPDVAFCNVCCSQQYPLYLWRPWPCPRYDATKRRQRKDGRGYGGGGGGYSGWAISRWRCIWYWPLGII